MPQWALCPLPDLLDAGKVQLEGNEWILVEFTSREHFQKLNAIMDQHKLPDRENIEDAILAAFSDKFNSGYSRKWEDITQGRDV